MLRTNTQPVPELDSEAPGAPSSDAERGPAPKVAFQGFDGLRAEIQRKLAAQIDLGEPDPLPSQPTQPQRVAPTPKADRRRMETMRADVQKNSTVRVERRGRGFSPSFGSRWRLKPSRIALIVVALLAGGLAAFLATQHEQPLAPVAMQPIPQIVQVPVARVLVARQAIGVGQRLTAESVEWQDWPGAVRPEFITASADPEAIAETTGSLARSEFLAGDPIRKEKLVQPGQGYLAGVLDKGMRGVSVSVAAVAASGGFIAPNDHVDVVVTRTSDARTVSETVLHDVRVLAINDRVGPAVPTAPGAPAPSAAPADPGTARVFTDQAVATLELDSTQAEVIINAAAVGKLSLVLLSLVDYPDADGGVASTDHTIDQTIRMTSSFWTK